MNAHSSSQARQQEDVSGSPAQEKTSSKSDGAFKTISEVADELDVQQHVLRFWETKFSQVRPLKRGGGRRYYRPEDVALLRSIHHLLYTEGYTIKGVQKMLKEQGKNKVVQNVAQPSSAPQNSSAPAQASAAHPVAMSPQRAAAQISSPAQGKPPAMSAQNRKILEDMLAELKELRDLVASE